MAYTSIDDPSAHFQIATYTGTGSTQSVGNDGNSNLKPDWVWIKKRNSTGNHGVFDSTRGATKELVTNGANAEATDAQLLTQFDTDGFTVGTNSGVNGSSDTFVGWQWKANGGTTSSNTDGTITSTVQANTTAGFSIVSYTGNGGTNVTVGHGLSSTPEIIILKDRDNAYDWYVYTTKVDGTLDFGRLNTTAAFSGSGASLPTSSVFYVTGTVANSSGDAKIAYLFNSVQGYSKCGKYVGNGNSNGAFVHTGFAPAFVMIKCTNQATNWEMFDFKRNPHNVRNLKLGANLDVAENGSDLGTTSQNNIDIVSNGFKCRTGNTDTNTNNGIFIYMAFAENPFVTSDTGGSIPTTAR